MKSVKLLSCLGNVDERYIKEAVYEGKKKKKKTAWLKWGAIAACMCIITVIVIVLAHQINDPTESPYYMYFRNNTSVLASGMTVGQSLADTDRDWAESRGFSDFREVLEQDGAIPLMDDSYTNFSAIANYDENGNILRMELFWGAYDLNDGWPDFKQFRITVADEEIIEDTDCISIPLDENGNVISDEVTVTIRDSVEIVGLGNIGKKEMSLTFYREDMGWVRIWCNGIATYDDIGALLDWVWEHGISFDAFAMQKGDDYTISTAQNDIEAAKRIFYACLPDLSLMDMPTASFTVGFKNGILYYYTFGYQSEDGITTLDGYCEYYDISLENDIRLEDIDREYIEGKLTYAAQMDFDIIVGNMRLCLSGNVSADLFEALIRSIPGN
ncbi:MAG: hypothetical protein WCY62_06270 [Clostridia bacterium]